jgi:hypothetical protein
MLNPYVDIALMELHSARGPPQSDLWDNANASEWEVNATHPGAADQDQSLH